MDKNRDDDEELDEDYETDDILDDLNKRKKKKKDSKDKGGRGERLLVKELEKRFPSLPFSRTVGSGARISQARMSEAAKQVFTGDIVAPENFLFALECKYGYNSISLERAVARFGKGMQGNAVLNSFLAQAQKDASKINRKPMLCWKQNYKEWLVFLKTTDLVQNLTDAPDKIVYMDWTAIPMIRVFSEPDSFFLKG